MTNARLEGRVLPRVGLGCMGMSEFYGPRDDSRSLAALHRAVEIGYRFLDTADMYGLGHNEQLVGRFLSESPELRRTVLVATKVGIVRDPDAKFKVSVDGRPEYIRRACDDSLRRLRADHLDLYYLHRRDPKVPIAETVGAMSELVRQGKVGAIGLCEVPAEAIRAAHREHPIAALQSEYSLWSRQVEFDVLPTCRQLGIAFVAFSPLGRGFLTGAMTKAEIQRLDPTVDLRARLPRFQEESVDANLRLVDRLRAIAARLDMPAPKLALAWVLAHGPNVHAIPGSTSVAHLTENFDAGRMQLPESVVEELGTVFAQGAVSGERYPTDLR